jgi:hypothetical protein
LSESGFLFAGAWGNLGGHAIAEAVRRARIDPAGLLEIF